MDERDNPDNLETTSATAWHPMLVKLFDQFLPGGWKLSAEFLLNRLPQRVDIVVIRLDGTPTTKARKIRSVFEHLRKHTLVEFKGPTDDLEAIDVLTLLAYACQYMAMHRIYEPDDMRLMVVADRIPPSFIQQVERMAGKFVAVGNGLWRGHIAGLSLHGVELREAHKAAPSERLLYVFSKAFLKEPAAIEPLDKDELEMYRLLSQQVVQFRRQRATMALRDVDLAEKCFEEVVEKFLQGLPPEQRLAGLTPEQVLAHYTPERLFASLTPEQRFAGLTPEQIAAALTPEALEIIARKARH